MLRASMPVCCLFFGKVHEWGMVLYNSLYYYCLIYKVIQRTK